MELDSEVWFFQIYKRKRVSAFIIDETIIQVGSRHFWLWFLYTTIHSSVLGIYISQERNMFVAEKLNLSLKIMENILYILMEVHGMMKHVMSWDLKHHLHSSLEKNLMERVNQYFKDGTESFDDY